jgi:TatD DNase family protein
LIDTHVHLLSRQFDSDRDSVIERAFKAGNEFLVEIATDLATSEGAVKLTRDYDGIFAAVGVHPHDAKTVDERTLAKLEELSGSPGVVAIGETGLDFYRDLSPRDVQKKVFIELIGLAKKRKLPLVIHIRDAYSEALEILEKEGAADIGGVLHCFAGEAASADRANALGFFLGFGGTITYGRSAGRRLISTLPLECVVLETDCPYLTPEPYRGKRNEPAYVRLVLEEIARLLRTSRDEVEKRTSLNARELFGVTQAPRR